MPLNKIKLFIDILCIKNSVFDDLTNLSDALGFDGDDFNGFLSAA